MNTSIDRHAWRRRRVLVTGANGFVGSHLTRSLCSLGAQVTALVRPSADCWRLADVIEDVSIIRCELARLATSTALERIGSVDVVYHLAAAGTNQAVHDATLMLQVNVLGTHEVVELARRLKANRIVIAGTGFEYGNVSNASETVLPKPVTAYAASKAAGSLFAHAYGRREGLSVVTLRTFSIYGPGQARNFLIPHVIMRVLAAAPVAVKNGATSRDFVFVEDAVTAYLLAGLAAAASDEVINVCSGDPILVADVVEAILSTADGRTEVALASTGSVSEHWLSSGNRDKALSVLGWKPQMDLGAGLRQTVEWFRAHQTLFEAKYPATAWDPTLRAGSAEAVTARPKSGPE